LKLGNWFIVVFGLAASCAYAGTITIPSGSSQSAIQGYFNSATSTNNVIQFQAGTYNAAGLTLPCVSGGVTITGPVTAPSYTSWGDLTYHSQTAILSPSSSGTMIFNTSGCTNPILVEYLQFANAGGINITPPSSNFTANYNSFINIPCHSDLNSEGWAIGCSYGEDQAFYIVNTGATLTNFTAEWNQIGDPNSCTSPQNTMTSNPSSGLPNGGDTGGTCAGMFVETNINGMTLANNSFYHTEEGVHVLCFGDACNGVSGGGGPPYPTIANIALTNNDFQQVHRINYEIQPQGASNITFEQNTVWNPYDVQEFSMGVSFACCAGNAPYGLIPGDVQCYPGGPSCASSTPATPNVPILENNVIIQNNLTTAGYGWGYSVEYFGWGAQALYNFVQATSLVYNGGFTYNATTAPVAVNYDSVCGPNIGGVIAPEDGSNLQVPTTTGSVFSSTCSATTTAAPSISPASGPQTFPLTVTLTDAGNTSSTTPIPQGNVTIWYTTDGSTPAPNSGTSQTCTTVGSTSCQFVMSSCSGTCTVRALGMWGQGANPISHPANYGFVPSAVISNSYMSTPLTSCTMTASPSVTALTVGGATTQMIGKCFYASTGQTLTCSPGSDTNGGLITSWSSSNTAVLNVGLITSGSPGVASGVTAGTATANATANGSVLCTPYSFTVSGPTLTGVSISLQAGGTTVNLGSPAQACATMTYAGVSPTQVCSSGSDIYGTTPTSWTSSAGGVATISASGLVTGVSAGSTNIGVSAGSFTSSPLGITVQTPPLNPAVTIQGPVDLQGVVMP
jgi:hypothetical protein